jgi:hypothetical protein
MAIANEGASHDGDMLGDVGVLVPREPVVFVEYFAVVPRKNDQHIIIVAGGFNRIDQFLNFSGNIL